MTSGNVAFTTPFMNSDIACCLLGHSKVSSSK